MYKILIYKDKNGKSEIENYIKNLQQKKDKSSIIKFAKITSYIHLLAEKGLTIGQPYIKHIDADIWELRPLKDRILFAYCEKTTFVLLSIFMKQTQKTPKREIEKAKKMFIDFKIRSESNE